MFKIPKAHIAQYRNVANEKGAPWVVVDYAPDFPEHTRYCASYHTTRAEARMVHRGLRRSGIDSRILRS